MWSDIFLAKYSTKSGKINTFCFFCLFILYFFILFSLNNSVSVIPITINQSNFAKQLKKLAIKTSLIRKSKNNWIDQNLEVGTLLHRVIYDIRWLDQLKWWISVLDVWICSRTTAYVMDRRSKKTPEAVRRDGGEIESFRQAESRNRCHSFSLVRITLVITPVKSRKGKKRKLAAGLLPWLHMTTGNHGYHNVPLYTLWMTLF